MPLLARLDSLKESSHITYRNYKVLMLPPIQAHHYNYNFFFHIGKKRQRSKQKYYIIIRVVLLLFFKGEREVVLLKLYH